MRDILVRVPATSANLGSGFDCLGLALTRYNTVRARSAERTRVTVVGEGADRLAGDSRNLIYRSIGAACSARGATPPPLALECENRIPVARGLGSSSSAIAAGLVIGNALMDNTLSTADLIRIGSRLEGHPDNIVPCLLGGVQVSVTDNGEVLTCRVSAPAELRAVIFIPDVPMRTEEARAALPKTVPVKQAVFNISRAALLVAALQSGRLDLLATATDDALHQPPRSKIFPAFPRIIEAALAAGAHGAFLSGAGSSVLALVTHNSDKIADAMQRAAADLSVGGHTDLADLDRQGATVMES